jgi:multiple sugar transport system substrate-binding protein
MNKLAYFALCLPFLLLSCQNSQESSQTLQPVQMTEGHFDWRACSGQTISLGLNKHPYTESLIREMAEFEELTGIQVKYNILAEEEYFEKLIIDLSTSSAHLDVFMTGPQLNWAYIDAGWVEPLDHFFGQAGYVPTDYNLDDFYPSLLAANRWNKLPGKQNLGRGSIWAIPIQVETYILAYRKDWAAAVKIKPPGTYDDFYGFAEALHRAHNGCGLITRGLGTWPTINTGFLTGYASCGCEDFDEHMKCQINSPRAVEFTKLWIKTIRDFGPPDWPNITWYDGKQKFSSGAYGMYPDCDFFAATYENPAQSCIVGQVGYALPPAGTRNLIKSNLWSWCLAINAHSRRKLASWLFLVWATSRRQLLSTALHGNLNPTRKSVWEDSQIKRMTEGWPGYREAVNANLNSYAGIQWTPQREFIAVGDRWARALQDIWGGEDAQKALDQAAKEIDLLMNNAYQK